ncbi:MAG: hypothetical protein MI924_11335, partial [Chloroflexales bacterium]|nr:hypothetical protein [Chloroflexales bacterium]
MDELLAPLADAREHTLVCALGCAHAVPILLVASTLLDGLIAATHPEATGVVVVERRPGADARRGVERGVERTDVSLARPARSLRGPGADPARADAAAAGSAAVHAARTGRTHGRRSQ